MDGKRLKRIREDQNFKPEDMAKLLNVSLRTYQSYERNERDPSTVNLAVLAVTFGVSSDYLIGVSDNPYTHPQPQQVNRKGVKELQKELNDIVNKIDDSDDLELLIEFAEFLLSRKPNKGD